MKNCFKKIYKQYYRIKILLVYLTMPKSKME